METMNIKWNRKYTGVLAGIVVAAVVGSSVGYRLIAKDGKNRDEDQWNMDVKESIEDAGNTFLGEGTTQIKTDDQLPDFSADVVEMTVEKVYASAGMEVEEGDALYKISEDSMTEAIAYYEDAVADANLALQTAQNEFSAGVLEAEAELKSTQLAADNAKSSYDASVSELNVKVEEKAQDVTDAVTKISNYQTALDAGTYYTQAQIDEKQSAVNAAEAAVAEKQNDYTAAQTAYADAQKKIADDMATLKTKIEANASYEELLTLTTQTAADYDAVQTATVNLTKAQNEADKAENSLAQAKLVMESAIKEYNTNVQTANERIAELNLQLEDLKADYEQAQRDVTTAQTQLEKEYNEAVLAGKYAGTEYETTLAELEKAVETAQDTLDELQEEQTALLAIADGVICADRAGTVAGVTYEEADTLRKDTAFVSYYDAETIYISVEVAQEHISHVAVGDEVQVAVAGNRLGMLSGKVDSVATAKTTGGSMSNVTYAVMISVDNTDGSLSSGSSATVTFETAELENSTEENSLGGANQ